MSGFPDHYGINFTSKTHEHPEGPTLPENNKPPSGQPFNVVVTGAGKGLGYAISIAYVKAGATGISISSRTQSDLDKLSSELKEINSDINIISQTCDTSKSEDVKNLAEIVKRQWNGRLDVVVANAGIISKYLEDQVNPKTGKVQARRLPVGIVEDDDFARVTTVNYLGSYYTAKYFTPLLIDKSNETKVRAYIVITSLASLFPISEFTPVAYNVSKVANNRMVEHMATDHKDDELLAFAVHPGEVVTPQTQGHSTESGDTWDSSKSFLLYLVLALKVLIVIFSASDGHWTRGWILYLAYEWS